MYSIFKNVINRGGYDLTNISSKIKNAWAENQLNDEQKDELLNLAQVGATLNGSVDIMKKLLELENRVRALEGAETSTEEYPDFVVGKWYQTGDKITFEDKQYICVAPEGVTCVWSPTDYPTYWEEKE